jgi:hypothetical protein
MSGPQGQDPNQQWSSGEPGQQPGPEDQTQHAAWQQPAYAPQQYPQGQSYPGTPQYQPPGQEYQQQYAPTDQPAQYGQQPPQYGQPGAQYQPGQYGQPQYPTTEGGYGQPQYTPPGAQYGEAAPGFGDSTAARKGSKGSLAVLASVIGVLAVIIVAVVLVMGFWKPGFFVTTKLDVSKAQDGVKDVLTNQTNGYGVKNVTDVKCNNGQNPTVKKGDSFTCDASIDNQHKQVTVTFQDDSGTYEVGRPK